MVICDICKTKIANRIAIADPVECDVCQSEICYKCALSLEIGTFCKVHIPKCKKCNLPLTEQCVYCERCEDSLHKTCAYQVKYDDPIQEKYYSDLQQWELRAYEHYEHGWLCTVHFNEYEEHKADSTVIIEYSIKLFKAIGLPPLKIERHITPDVSPQLKIASLALKDGWMATITHPKVGIIHVLLSGFGFENTVKVSTYNHENAVGFLRERFIKLLLHHKRRFQNVGCSPRLTNMLKIVTASKNVTIQN